MCNAKFEQVRVSFFFPQVFLCEPEPEENFAPKKKAEEHQLQANIRIFGSKSGNIATPKSLYHLEYLFSCGMLR